jgi:hypothetical protein
MFCYMQQKTVMVPQNIALLLQYCTYIFATILFPYLKQPLSLKWNSILYNAIFIIKLSLFLLMIYKLIFCWQDFLMPWVIQPLLLFKYISEVSGNFIYVFNDTSCSICMECVYVEKCIEWLHMTHRDLAASPINSVRTSRWVGMVCNISNLKEFYQKSRRIVI